MKNSDTKVLKHKMSIAEKKEAAWAYLFVAPTIIGLLVLNFYPIISTIYQSFCKTGDFGRGNIFIGLGNYQKLLFQAETWQSIWNTIKYALIEVPFGIAIALVLAVLLNEKIKGRAFFRTIFFLPMVCAPAAVAMVWKWLYNQQFGLINNILGTNVAWVNDPNITWISIGIIGVWSVLGYNIVLFISGLQEIPGDYYEAAEIDGAGPIRTLVQIYLPLSTSVLATLALFYAVGRWNGFSDALLYIKKREDLFPIQLLLYNILQNSTNVEIGTQEGFFSPGVGETLKMATVMFATVPILLVYPWLQRYFVTGVTIGAVKG